MRFNRVNLVVCLVDLGYMWIVRWLVLKCMRKMDCYEGWRNVLV